MARKRLSAVLLVAVATSLLVLALSSLSSATGFTLIPDPAKPSLPAGSHLETVADLSGHVADFVLVNETRNQIGVMLGDGAGGFSPPSWISLEGKAGFVTSADVNGDGRPDLVVPLETILAPHHEYPIPDEVEIIYGDGHGNFTVGPIVKLPEEGPVYAGDFNGDGHQDLLVTPGGCRGDVNATKYSLLLGNGEGGFSPAPANEAPGLGGCRSLVADLNGDGKDDLLTDVDGPGESPRIMVLPGEANGSFGAPVFSPMLPSGVTAAFIAGLGDLNGDGVLDLVLRAPANPMAQILVLDGNGAGGFTQAGAYPAEQPNRFEFGVGIGDFTGDGHPDIATVGSQISVLENENETLSNVLDTPLTEAYDEVLVADVNGDGRPDLIFPEPQLQIFLDEPTMPTLVAPIDRSVLGPLLRDFRESHVRWRVRRAAHNARGARHRDARSRHVPTGTRFSFTLNEPASVSFEFVRQLPGRRNGRSCTATRKHSGSRRACTLTVPGGELTRAGHAGTNSLSFEGWLSRSKRLVAGRYALVLTAANASGRSPSQQLSFEVVN